MQDDDRATVDGAGSETSFATAAPADRPALTRRGLLGGALAGMALAGGGALALPAGGPGKTPEAVAGAGAAGSGRSDRAERAYRIRLQAAEMQRGLPAAHHAANGDEDLPGRFACYAKGLPHNALGEVDPASYRVLLKALRSGDLEDFETIPLGGQVKLANPQGGYAYNLIGCDPAAMALAAPPRFGSAEQAAELVELYWQALARDVPFADYGSHPLAQKAADDLSRLTAFRGPRAGGRVTPATLFRGIGEGGLAGPYVSQFFWKDVPFTPIRVEQKLRTAVAGLDYLTSYPDWLASQNGALAGVNRFDDQARYIRNGRDLGEFVHRDFSFQAGLAACLILFKMGAPPDGGNPYMHSRTQSGFTTFGPPYLLDVLAIVTQVALTASWYQKWLVHRRIRPEELAGRVETQQTGKATYPLHAEILASGGLAETLSRHATALLPAAYPEGCPTHPSYPAGHAILAGAAVTVLKAFFDESFVVPNPVVPAPDGLSLRPYSGPPLTVGGELDKLAANVAMGRNFAGLHWRTDMTGGFTLGEELAINVLHELKLTGHELFSGFSLRRFDGRRETV